MPAYFVPSGIVAPVKSAVVRFERDKSAPVKFASRKFVFNINAPDKSAPDKSAPDKSASTKSARCKLAIFKFAPLKLA